MPSFKLPRSSHQTRKVNLNRGFVNNPHIKLYVYKYVYIDIIDILLQIPPKAQEDGFIYGFTMVQLWFMVSISTIYSYFTIVKS